MLTLIETCYEESRNLNIHDTALPPAPGNLGSRVLSELYFRLTLLPLPPPLPGLVRTSDSVKQ